MQQLNLRSSVVSPTSSANISSLKRQAVQLNFLPVRKKRYVIWAEILSPDAPPREVYNYLEDCAYRTGGDKSVILTGTASEQWIMDIDRFCRTYVRTDGKSFTPVAIAQYFADYTAKHGYVPYHLQSLPVISNPSGSGVWAAHLSVSATMQIKTSWGDILTANRPGIPHGTGDWIIAANGKDGGPNMEDRWVVNGAIFVDTYEADDTYKRLNAVLQELWVGNSSTTPESLLSTVEASRKAGRLSDNQYSELLSGIEDVTSYLK